MTTPMPDSRRPLRTISAEEWVMSGGFRVFSLWMGLGVIAWVYTLAELVLYATRMTR
jgi:hypothetical protein